MRSIARAPSARCAELSATTGLAVRPRATRRRSVGRRGAARRDPQDALPRREDPRFSTSRPRCSRRPRSTSCGPCCAGCARAASTIVLITHKLDEVMDDLRLDHRDAPGPHRRSPAHGAARRRRDRAGDGRPRRARSRWSTSSRTGRRSDRRRRTAVASAGDAAARRARSHRRQTRDASTAVHGVSFAVAPGEILGIAGVEGNGQTELIEAIAGLRAVARGAISLGRPRCHARCRCKRAATPASRTFPKIATRAASSSTTRVAENLILGQQHRFTRGVRLDQRRRFATTRAQQIAAFDIRPPIRARRRARCRAATSRRSSSRAR